MRSVSGLSVAADQGTIPLRRDPSCAALAEKMREKISNGPPQQSRESTALGSVCVCVWGGVDQTVQNITVYPSHMLSVS